ncbi:MAG: hypothetical protein H6925_05190 [Holosporaceae bacterium]|nr:MAG: hypothetical protein H6925_05190 [Holosporaceae bacterium]
MSKNHQLLSPSSFAMIVLSGRAATGSSNGQDGEAKKRSIRTGAAYAGHG